MTETSVSDDEKRRVEAEFLRRLQEQMQELSVHDHLVGVLQTLSSLAFQYLGVTRETAGRRDLDQSRLAIDAFRALTDVLAPVRPPDEVALYRSTLSQMQLAFVTALELARQTEPAAEPEVADEPAAATQPEAEAGAADDIDPEPPTGAADDIDPEAAATSGAVPIDEEE
jgi:hypothetical protein